MHDRSVLNPEQRAAVEHIEGPLLVLAGAGSGKTRVVTQRVAHLIELGVPSNEILALTFTNKAAGEMRDRIKQLTDQNVLASTFHSLCARVLRESIESLGYKSSFTIYDQQDSDSLIKGCLKALDLKVEKSAVRSYRSAISTAKNALLSPDECDKDVAPIYDLYQRKLREYNALDFDDLLYLTVQLLQSDEKALEMYQTRWNFLLIDEYQDTNRAQYELTRLLVTKHNNLFVVGDPDQSIYSWRGADVHNILHFEEDFQGAKVIALEQNYRSTQNILKAANHLIEHNRSRYEKNLWSGLGEGEKPSLYIADSESDEARFAITQLMKHHRNDQISLNDMVIFYRTNAQSRIYEDLLLKANIPYQIVGGVSFYQRKEIKDVLAYLRLLVSPYDFIAFSRVINLPKRGVGATTLQRLKDEAEAKALSILEVCQMPDCKLSAKAKGGINEFLGAVDALRRETSIKDQIIGVLEHFRYLEVLREDPETFEDRKENVDELITKSIEFQKFEEDPSLFKFLEELSLKASLDETTQSEERLKLMTLHNGKGLEFQAVCLVGLEEDMLPHQGSKETSESIEEERRLCYVGMTRAMRHLHLSAAKYRTVWGMPRNMQLSRFLNEVPSDLIVKVGGSALIDEDDENPYRVGTAVLHKSFGEGVIQKFYQTSLGPTVDVLFHRDQSVRTLVTKYAKLARCT